MRRFLIMNLVDCMVRKVKLRCKVTVWRGEMHYSFYDTTFGRKGPILDVKLGS